MIDFEIQPDDGDKFVMTADSRDILAWERANREKNVSDLLGDDKSMVDLYRLAHYAASRQGLYTGKLDDFENTHVIKRVSDTPADPTE